MPGYCYNALDEKGGRHAGRCEAASLDAAAAGLRQKGLFPVRLRKDAVSLRSVLHRWCRDAAAAARVKPAAWRGTGGHRSLVMFTRQMATMLRAGLPLMRALETLIRQERNPGFRAVLVDLGEGIRAGEPLSEGLSRHPRVFPPVYSSMVRAGEAVGALAGVFGRLALFLEKAARLRSKVCAAMAYPAVVLGVSAVIMSGLLLFVVPRFELIYRDLLKGAPLPWLTRMVMGGGALVRDLWPLLLAAAVAACISCRLLLRTERGRELGDRLLLALPLAGNLARKAAIARFAHTLGTLLSGGVPILSALDITRETSGNAVVAGAVAAVRARVKDGDPLAGPLESSGVFPPMVTGMIGVGEETGALPDMLQRIADTFDDEVDAAVGGLTALLEPVMIVILAVVVGLIVIALFLPLVEVIRHLG